MSQQLAPGRARLGGVVRRGDRLGLRSIERQLGRFAIAVLWLTAAYVALGV